MTEPNWVPLGATVPIDYVGAWVSGITYKPGDIVKHNGIDYLAVNVSTGSTPPAVPPLTMPIVGIGTSLPVSPTDGQEYILVDSLITPTYSWRFYYVAAISDSYKWVFIGGSALQVNADAAQVTPTNQGTYIGLTGGPDITIPRAGMYNIEQGYTMTVYNDAGGGAGGRCYMSYAIGATAAIDADAVNAQPYIGALAFAVMGSKIKTISPAATILASRYRHDNYGGSVTWTKRWMRAIPVRVS